MRKQKSLLDGVFNPAPTDMYGDYNQFWAMSVVTYNNVVGEHNLRDRTIAIDPVADAMAASNAEYWAERGVSTIHRNDFRFAKSTLLDITLEQHGSFWRAVHEERDAMKPKRQPKPADVVSFSELRKAREARAAAEAERARLAASLVEQADGQIALRLPEPQAASR